MDEQKMPVIIIGLNTGQKNFNYSMEELEALVEANNMVAEETMTQALDRPNAGTYFGKGKVEELATLILDTEIKDVIVNDQLSPSQIRNLEAETKGRIIDRTGLILEIFANRAQSKEAQLQVQLAKLQYQLPRLHTSVSQRLDQQTGSGGGGGFTNRGAGESQTELDRRTLEHAISHVRGELKELQTASATQRKQRDRQAIPTVALVGYTNAGKSTIMNALVDKYGMGEDRQVFVKNMLFATLDTSIRQLTFPDQKKLLLSDTVGFVSQLPTQLVAAFRSTLEEAAKADLLIQVVDYSDENRDVMMETTESTLKEIGVTDVPMVTIFNKADLTDAPFPNREGDSLIMSAKDDASIEALVAMVKEQVFVGFHTVKVLVPFDKGDVVSYLNDNAHVMSTDYGETGTAMTVELSDEDFNRFQQYIQE